MSGAEDFTPEPDDPDADQDAEPDDPELDPDAEPDPDDPEFEPEARQHVPSSMTVTEERMKQMNAAAKTHESRLRTILGADFEEYGPCPLCLADAFLVQVPPGQMPDEQWEAIQAVAGQLRDQSLRHAEYAEMCDVCDGYGTVLTGSRNPAQATVPCRVCEGKGWKAKLAEAVPVAPLPLPTFPTTAAPMTLNWNGQKDDWGRPAGHPHFGMEPALVGMTG